LAAAQAQAEMTNQTRLAVTIDARALDGALMGTQVHVLELVRALARTGELSLRVLIYAERIDRATLGLLRGLPGTEILAVEEIDEQTPTSAVFHRPLQAFSPGDVALAWRLGERVVLNQLDLIAYRSPGYFPDTGAWEDYRRAARHGMAAAERVVVFSAHTRSDLLADELVEPERIKVIPPGLDHRFAGESRRPAGLELAVSSADRDASGLLLCLGADYEHKNRVFALRLLAALRERHGWRGTLVLAGAHMPNGSSREAEREELATNPRLREAVIELGSVSEAEKEWLLEHAEAVVYPSLYEGFGLVPFEAALRGVPCVFAPVSSLADERTAGAATIVPWDPVASAAAAHALLSDPAARARHVQLLADGARELTWEHAARATLAAYREASTAPVRVAATLSRDAVAREARLTAAHEAVAQRLIDERELVLGDYDALLAEVGPARGLIGAHGALPVDLQRALLALSAHPRLSRPVYGLVAGAYRLARALARTVRGPRSRA
jgi:glycosyltransferase involved in cell wall biosynthesis